MQYFTARTFQEPKSYIVSYPHARTHLVPPRRVARREKRERDALQQLDGQLAEHDVGAVLIGGRVLGDHRVERGHVAQQRTARQQLEDVRETLVDAGHLCGAMSREEDRDLANLSKEHAETVMAEEEKQQLHSISA